MTLAPRLLPTLAFVNSVILCGAQVYGAPLGTYRTAPGATATYAYQSGSVVSASIPVDVTMTFTGSPALLSATIHKPIIGALADGTLVYPIGGTFPRTAEAQSTDDRQFAGTLESQYMFEWTIDAGSLDELLWNGNVAWVGGRLEHTTISDVRLIPIAEPRTALSMSLAMLAVSYACRHFQSGASSAQS